jgi:hypothetical protein
MAASSSEDNLFELPPNWQKELEYKSDILTMGAVSLAQAVTVHAYPRKNTKPPESLATLNMRATRYELDLIDYTQAATAAEGIDKAIFRLSEKRWERLSNLATEEYRATRSRLQRCLRFCRSGSVVVEPVTEEVLPIMQNFQARMGEIKDMTFKESIAYATRSVFVQQLHQELGKFGLTVLEQTPTDRYVYIERRAA